MSSQTPPPFKPTLDPSPIDPSTERKGDLSPFEQSIFDSIMQADRANVEASNRPRSALGEALGLSRGFEKAIGLGAADTREASASFLQANLDIVSGAMDLGRQLWNEAVNNNPMLTIDDPVMAPDAKAMLQAGAEVMSDPSVILNIDELNRRALEHLPEVEGKISKAEAGDRLLIGLRQGASAFGGLMGFVGGAPGAVMRGAGAAIGKAGASVLGQTAIRGLSRMGYTEAKISEIAKNGQLWAEYVRSATEQPVVRFALEKLEKWGLPLATGAGGFAGVSFLEGGAGPGQESKDIRGRTGDAAVSAVLSTGFVMAGALANAVESKIFRTLTSKKIKGELGQAWKNKQLRGGLKGRIEASRTPSMREVLDMDMSKASGEVKKWLQGRAKWNARIAGTIGGLVEGLGFQMADLHTYKELLPAIYQGDQDKINEALSNMLAPSIGTSLGMAFLRGRTPSQSAAWRRQFPEENMISAVVEKDLSSMEGQAKRFGLEKPKEAPKEGEKETGTTALAKAGPGPETLESADMLHRAGWSYRGTLIDANEGKEGAPSDTMQFGVPSVPGSMDIRHGPDGMTIEVDPRLAKYVLGVEPDEKLTLKGNNATEFFARATFKTTRDAIEARLFLLNSPIGQMGLVEMGQNDWHSADSTLRFTYRDGEVYQQDIREGVSSAQPWKKVPGFTKDYKNKAGNRDRAVAEVHSAWLKVIAGMMEKHGGDPYLMDAIETMRQANNLLIYSEAGDPNAVELMKVLSDESIFSLVSQIEESGDRATLLDTLHEITLVASGDSNAQFVQQELARRLQNPIVPATTPEANPPAVSETGTPEIEGPTTINQGTEETKRLGRPPAPPRNPVEARINQRRAKEQNANKAPDVIEGEGPAQQAQLPAPEESPFLRGTSMEAALEMRAQAETVRSSRNWSKAPGPQRWKNAGLYASLMEQAGEELTYSGLARDFQISRPKAKDIIEEVRAQLKSIRAEATARAEAMAPEEEPASEEVMPEAPVAEPVSTKAPKEKERRSPQAEAYVKASKKVSRTKEKLEKAKASADEWRSASEKAKTLKIERKENTNDFRWARDKALTLKGAAGRHKLAEKEHKAALREQKKAAQGIPGKEQVSLSMQATKELSEERAKLMEKIDQEIAADDASEKMKERRIKEKKDRDVWEKRLADAGEATEKGWDVTDEVVTESGRKVKVGYTVVDASDLITSHDAYYNPVEIYDQALQNRDRSLGPMKESVERMAKALDPERLHTNRVASSGAPIIGPDYMVESGNGRALAIIKALWANRGPLKERGDDYKDMIASKADELGLTKEMGFEKGETEALRRSLDKDFSAPVLVRMRLGRMSRDERIQFAQEANAQSLSQMSIAEKARADAGLIDIPMMRLFSPGESGDVSLAKNNQFVAKFLNALPASERTSLTRDNGKLTKEGKDRIKNAVFYKAWQDFDLATSIMNDEQEGIRRMGAALLGAAPKMIELEASIEAGKKYDLGIKYAIVEAVKYVARMKRSGETWEDHFSHTDLFGERPEGAQKIITKALWDYYRSGKRMQAYIVGIIEAVNASWGPNERQDIFGNDVPAPNLEEVSLASKELIDAEIEAKDKEGEGPTLPGFEEESGKPAQRGNPEETQEFGPETGAVLNPFPSILDALDKTIDNIKFLRNRDRQRKKYLPDEKRTWKDLKSWLGWIGKRHVNWLRDLKGSTAKELAFDTEDVDMRAADFRGDWIQDFDNELYDWKKVVRGKKYSAEQEEELHRDLGAYMNARAGAVDPIEVDYEGGLEPTLETLRKNQLDEMRAKWGEDIAQGMEMARVGLTDILDDGLNRLKDLGETRQVGEEWLPIEGSGKPLGQSLNAIGAAAVRAAHKGDMTDPALREMVSYLMETQPKRYPDEKTTIAKIKSFEDRDHTVSGTNSYYRRSRVELPLRFLEMDPWLLLPHLLTKNAYYVAGVEKWGPGLRELTKTIDEVGKENPRDARAINEFYKSYYGHMERKRGDAVAGAIGQYVTVSKLGWNFAGALRNMGQRVINVYPYVSTLTMAESMIEYPPLISRLFEKGRRAEETHKRSGAVKAETALTAVESDYGTVKHVVRMSLKPFTETERGNQVFTSVATARQFTKDMHKLLRHKKGDLPGVKKVIDAIQYATTIANTPEKIRAKWKEATAGHVNDAEMDRAIQQILEYDSVPVETLKKVTTYLTSRTQFGLSMSTQRNWYPRHPLMRNLPFKFMTFSLDQFGLTRDQFKTMFNWAARKHAYGNPWPMVKFVLAAALVGSVVQAIKDWLLGTDKSAITKAVRDGNLDDTDELMMRMLGALTQSGLTWPLSDIMYDQSIMGTFSSTLENTASVVVDYIQDPKDAYNLYLAMWDASKREFPIIRQGSGAMNQAKAAIGKTGLAFSDFPKEMRQRNDMMLWRSASRDWRDRDKHPGIAGMTKQYLDRVFNNQPNYTVNDKTLRYKYARDDIMWNNLGEAANKIADILEKAKADPDPDALKRAITSIRGSLEGGGPNMVAKRDLDRFRRSIYDADPKRLKNFDQMRALWLRRVDRVVDMAQKKAGTQVSEGARFSSRASAALRSVPFEPLIDVAISEGPNGMKKRLQRPYELFQEAAQRSPEILAKDFRRAWERRGRPETMLWQYFYTSRVIPRLKKARRLQLLRNK